MKSNIIRGTNCKLGKIKIVGFGEIILGDDVVINDDVIINVSERLEIGDRSIIGKHFEISGRDIKIGREFWSGRYCGIGGGSCFEKLSSFEIGDFGHLGDFSFINTTRPVKIGDEVGLGQDTKIYTHGSYLNYFEGFPVKIGPITIEDRVWCPKAIVLPSLTIGHDTVIGVGAVVTKSIPSNCLAGGVPAKVIKYDVYPKKHNEKIFEKEIEVFINIFHLNIKQSRCKIKQFGNRVFVDETLFDMGSKRIDGKATELTEKFKNELRRYGYRFRYFNDNGVYRKW